MGPIPLDGGMPLFERWGPTCTVARRPPFGSLFCARTRPGAYLGIGILAPFTPRKSNSRAVSGGNSAIPNRLVSASADASNATFFSTRKGDYVWQSWHRAER